MTLERVIERLQTLGYETKETDAYSLEFCISKVENHICNLINDSSVPNGLEEIAIEMVCGEFLKLSKGMGLLNSANFEQVAKSVKLGDTNITFADDASPEQKFEATIDYLLRGYNEDFLRYRKLVW